MWEFANHNPAAKLSAFDLDKLNEPVKGNVLLSTETGSTRRDKYDVPVQMRQLWADFVHMKEKKREFQPFCLTELRNKKRITNSKGESELTGDIVFGCSEGTLAVYDVKSGSRIKSNASIYAGVSGHVESGRLMAPESLQEKRWLTVLDAEPITHVYEYRRKSDLEIIQSFDKKNGDRYAGVIFFCTINGIVYLIKHHEKTLLQKFDLSNPIFSPLKGQRRGFTDHGDKKVENIVYYMGPYNSADISSDYEEANHLVIVHD